MKNSLFIFATAILSLFLNSCYSDAGRTSESDEPGFKQYKNNTIGASVLSPEGWKSEVTSGGVYTLTSPESEERGMQIYVMSRAIKDRMNQTALPNAGLEDYKKYTLSQTNEETTGAKFKRSIKKSTLSGLPAYEMNFAYTPTDGSGRMFVRSLFTFAHGKIYHLEYYSKQLDDPEWEAVFKKMRESYQIFR